METPDHSNVVEATANEYPQLLQENTLESIQEFMLILGPRMYDADPSWGYLTKTPGEKHITLPDGQIVSVDSFIYGPTDQVVDVLTNAADPAYGSSSATWQHKEKRDENNWYPIKDYDGGSGGSTPEPPSDVQTQLDDLQRQINELKEAAIKYEDKIALLSSSNKYICAEGGGPSEDHGIYVFTARASVAAWESFKVLKGQ
jgi:hypothetical protein